MLQGGLALGLAGMGVVGWAAAVVVLGPLIFTLQGGLALGLAGMGVVGWAAAGVVLGPLIFTMLPKAAKQGVLQIFPALGSTFLAQFGGTFTIVGDILEKR